MNKLKLALIVLLFSVGLVKTQPAAAQTPISAAKESVEFKFTTWNTEWLSCSLNGPTNDELQINNIVAVIKTMNSDLVALQEVGTSNIYTTVDTIVRRLGSEWAGSIIASTIDNCAQNQGIVYKKSRVQLINASLIVDGGSSYVWSSGRFPVLYNVNLLDGSNVIPVSFISIHAKAMGDETSYLRRKNASIGLKALLDGTQYNTKNVVLLGDFNDYLSGTQCATCLPLESPYKNFADDIINYQCLTTALYDPKYAIPVIDNIIISKELFDNYIQNSAKRDETSTLGIPNYSYTTSDHVPVSANFNIVPVQSTCKNISYSETFALSLGEFAQYSVEGTQTWAWRQIYGATVSGYATAVNNPNEDWLISPAFDLSDKSSATLSFNHAINFSLIERDKLSNHTLWVSTDYTVATPENATWTQLTIPSMPPGNNWVFVNSGNIVLPIQYLKKNVRFGFKYLSTSTSASTWEIKDFTFNTNCITTNEPIVTKGPECKVYVLNKQIKIENKQLKPVSVYDITGRSLFSISNERNTEIPVYQQGVYIVRVGNEVYKVIVK